MNHYRIYDEHIASDVPLHYTELSSSPGSAWTLRQAPLDIQHVHKTLIHAEEDFPGGPTLRMYQASGYSVVDYAGWRFACHDDRVEYEGEASHGIDFQEVIERVIAPWMMLSRRESVLALHGGAVSHDDRALIFMGESGAGKSSAALELVRCGAALLSDDMALVDLATMSAMPGAWTLRMWHQDAGSDLIDEGVIVGTQGRKHRFRYSRTIELHTGVPLMGVVELVRDESCAERGELKELSGVRALGTLLGQCFDLSHPSRAWSERRMSLARQMLDELGCVQQLRYATSTSGDPVHAKTLWEVWGG